MKQPVVSITFYHPGTRGRHTNQGPYYARHPDPGRGEERKQRQGNRDFEQAHTDERQERQEKIEFPTDALVNLGNDAVMFSHAMVSQQDQDDHTHDGKQLDGGQHPIFGIGGGGGRTVEAAMT